MRHKDEAKQQAIIDATVKLVNQIGFVASSVSKIAKEADVSPATLYVYYKNKEDLLVSTYVEIKQELSAAILEGFDDSRSVRDVMRDFWMKAFSFVRKYPDKLQYTEQFANSPFSALVDKNMVEKYFEPMIKVIRRGIEQKILKDVPLEMFQIFIFYPVLILANPRLCADFDCSQKNIKTAFDMAWDAIKL
jgi:AcrR family transcriptional regulator